MVFEFFNEILLDLYKNCSCVTGGVYFPPDLKFYGYFYEATDCYKIDEKRYSYIQTRPEKSKSLIR